MGGGSSVFYFLVLTMDERELENLVRGLMFDAQEKPGLYRFKLLCFVLFAYAFILLMVALALGIAGGILWGLVWTGQQVVSGNIHFSFAMGKVMFFVIPIALGAIVFALTSLRSLWVVLPEPEGLVLERGQAITLFQEIERLREALGVPSFHQVILTDDFNAAALQIPRFGIFGFQRNYFLVGIPLLLTLSPEHLSGVLAHEMAHLSRKHSAFGAWIARMSYTWRMLLATLEAQENSGFDIFYAFFSWFVPRMTLRSFAMRRQTEFEADKLAAEAVGTKPLADSLIQITLFERSLSEPNIERPVPRMILNHWMNDALQEHDHFTDSHPSLQARLRNIGHRAELPEPMKETAAEKYLGHHLLNLAASVGIQVDMEKLKKSLVNLA